MTAVKPTTMETRAPKMSRERTSRPRWSVPRRCSALPPACHTGGWKRSPSEPISGLYGVITLAKIATSASVRRRSEERRVGKEGRARWSKEHEKEEDEREEE